MTEPWLAEDAPGRVAALDSAVTDALVSALGAEYVSSAAADTQAVAADLWPPAVIRARQARPLPSAAAIVWPGNEADVVMVYQICSASGVPVTTVGAGTGVCGAAIPVRGGVVLDTKRLDGVGPWDLVSGHVRVQPGVLGMRLESEALARGWSTGHYPSSLPISTVGGFVATRSVGQTSTRYGRIDDMVAGLRAVLPDGTVAALTAQPAAGAGPDMRRLLLGSEGAMGTITEVTLRLHPAPEHRADRAFLVPSFPVGIETARSILQAGLRPSLLRLYDADDTALQVDHLDIPAVSAGACLLLVSCEGRRLVAEAELAEVARDAIGLGATDLGPDPVRAWYPRRYRISFEVAKYMPEPGNVIDTIEVAAPWARLAAVHQAVREATSERFFTLCHLSHGYVDGACLYFTFLGGGAEDDALALAASLWESVMHATHGAGGTIGHHHGAGLARAPHLHAELGGGALKLLHGVLHAVDPAGIVSPGRFGLPL